MEALQLRDAVCSYCYTACRAITACRELARVVEALQRAWEALLDNTGVEATDAGDDGEGEPARRRALALAAAAAVEAAATDAQQLVQRAFYASPGFHEVADTLLTGTGVPLTCRGAVRLGGVNSIACPPACRLLVPALVCAQWWRPTGCRAFPTRRGATRTPAGLSVRPPTPC